MPPRHFWAGLGLGPLLLRRNMFDVGRRTVLALCRRLGNFRRGAGSARKCRRFTIDFWLDFAKQLGNQPLDVEVGVEVAESRYSLWTGCVPIVLGWAHEVAN